MLNQQTKVVTHPGSWKYLLSGFLRTIRLFISSGVVVERSAFAVGAAIVLANSVADAAATVHIDSFMATLQYRCDGKKMAQSCVEEGNSRCSMFGRCVNVLGGFCSRKEVACLTFGERAYRCKARLGRHSRWVSDKSKCRSTRRHREGRRLD